MRLAPTRIEDDAPARVIIQEIAQGGLGVGAVEDALQVRHVDPVGREGGLVGRPCGEGAPVVVLGHLGAEEEVALADHLPDDVDDLEAAAAGGGGGGRGGEFHVGGLERGAEALGRGEEVGGGEETVAAAAELGGDEGGVGDVGDDVVV